MEPKILLVDDREDNLLSVETILAPLGYRFVKATSGKDALTVMKIMDAMYESASTGREVELTG